MKIFSFVAPKIYVDKILKLKTSEYLFQLQLMINTNITKKTTSFEITKEIRQVPSKSNKFLLLIKTLNSLHGVGLIIPKKN